jgi:threonine/homoserine/homoserine lactone efflux protein
MDQTQVLMFAVTVLPLVCTPGPEHPLYRRTGLGRRPAREWRVG